MLFQLIAEATECDFKEAVEAKKPKSWLKSASAFANGIGGTLLFGVADEKTIVGLTNAQHDAEVISEKIKDRISPMPNVVLTPYHEKGKDYIALVVKPGSSTPYYYVADGLKQAFVRLGNESVPAPDHILNELILRGTHQTYDAVPTHFNKNDYSFTLLEATYLQRTKLHFESKDYASFSLVTNENMLTRAGSLLTDQHIVYNSRVFCTRWNGLEKGSIYDDAIDDKEFEGNLIYLLQNASDFVRTNSKVRFAKAATERIDKPDYAERAITEALVNALIHRDYLVMGSEVHVDMFDDRLEITSPGGMLGGINVQDQDINNIKSERRNPIIADLFHRMRYMERRGSGLRKIVNETAKLPGYTEDCKPVFYSTPSSFTVVIKNVNYNMNGTTIHVTDHDTVHVVSDREASIIEFCSVARTREEIQTFIGITNRGYFRSSILKPLLDAGKLKMTIPDKPKSTNQKYIKA